MIEQCVAGGMSVFYKNSIETMSAKKMLSYSNGDSMPHNIDKFDQVVAYIFAELYKSFPVRKAVDIYTFYDCKEGEYIAGIWYDSGELTIEDQKFFCDTICWLIDTGYVIGTLKNQMDHRANITLSMKGLQLLKSVPKSVNNKATLGDQLLSVLSSGAKESAASLVGKALTCDNIFTQISDLFSSGQ